VVSRSEFDISHQYIVVADDESPAAALLIDTLRLDGHRVTHVSVQSAAFDLALDATLEHK
jgi:hypothetical protein